MIELEEREFLPWAHATVVKGEEHLLKEGIFQHPAKEDEHFIPGSIKGKQKVYEDVGADKYVVDTVREGYKLVFDTFPPPSVTKNNKSARENPIFVREEIKRLVSLGCVQETAIRPTLVLPLSLVYSNKWRLCLDCSRGLNPYCTTRKVTLSDLRHVAHTVKQNDYMVVNDLASGYWQVPVHETDQQLLGFQFEDENGSNNFYFWKVLVLGVKDAVYLFTRLTAPLMAALRKDGFRGQIYIDDVLTAGSSKEETLQAESKLYRMFNKGGWVFKPSKRSGDPSQQCQYLGLIIDSTDMTFNIPDEKVKELENMLEKVKGYKNRGHPVRDLAKLVGKIQSLRLATGPIVSVLTRSLYAIISAAKTWGSWVKLDDLALFEVNWWLKNLKHTKKFPISVSLSTTVAQFKVASDASDIGHYCYLTGKVPRVLAARDFSQQERGESSTWRELSAFHETWTNKDNLEEFKNSRVAHYSDSQAMVYIVGRGSRNRKLQPMIVEATVALRKYGISMEAVWVSRNEEIISLADLGSRDYDRDDISLDFDTMVNIYQEFGDFDLDAMATATTSKGKKFFSRRQTPGTSGVNFFHQTLSPGESIFCFPPPRLLVPALRHVENQKTRAVFVVPVWPASTFYSVFWPDGTHALESTQRMILINPYFICG